MVGKISSNSSAVGSDGRTRSCAGFCCASSAALLAGWVVIVYRIKLKTAQMGSFSARMRKHLLCCELQGEETEVQAAAIPRPFRLRKGEKHCTTTGSNWSAAGPIRRRTGLLEWQSPAYVARRPWRRTRR